MGDCIPSEGGQPGHGAAGPCHQTAACRGDPTPLRPPWRPWSGLASGRASDRAMAWPLLPSFGMRRLPTFERTQLEEITGGFALVRAQGPGLQRFVRAVVSDPEKQHRINAMFSQTYKN